MYRFASLALHVVLTCCLMSFRKIGSSVFDACEEFVTDPGSVVWFIFVFVIASVRGAKYWAFFLGFAWYANVGRRDGPSPVSGSSFATICFLATLALLVCDFLVSRKSVASNRGSVRCERTNASIRITCPSCHGTGTWAVGSEAIGSSQTKSRMYKACSTCNGQGSVNQ